MSDRTASEARTTNPAENAEGRGSVYARHATDTVGTTRANQTESSIRARGDAPADAPTTEPDTDETTAEDGKDGE